MVLGFIMRIVVKLKYQIGPVKPSTQTPSTITKIDARYVNLKSGQKGDWNKIANKPEANTIYKLDNGYTYKTDANGRVNNVEANLKLEANDRNNYQQKNSGKIMVGFQMIMVVT